MRAEAEVMRVPVGRRGWDADGGRVAGEVGGRSAVARFSADGVLPAAVLGHPATPGAVHSVQRCGPGGCPSGHCAGSKHVPGSEEEQSERLATMTVSRSIDHSCGTPAANQAGATGTATAARDVLTAGAVLHLQRTAGNSAVSKLLGRQPQPQTGRPVIQAAPPPGGALTIQRTTDPVHLRPLRPGAQGCLVHLHGDETNALDVARELYREHCVNLVYIDHPGSRLIRVDVPGHRRLTCKADPNRIFDDAAITSQWAKRNSGACLSPSARPDAEAAVRSYRDAELLPRIGQCRGGAVGAGPTGGTRVGSLPVVAFHNNTPGSATARPTRPGTQCTENLTILSYEVGHCEAAATETDQLRISGQPNPTVPLKNPAIDPRQDVDNFILVTDPREFRLLRATRNVVLQALDPPDDGSLSVRLRTGRYVNIEAENTGSTKPVNKKLGEEALKALGIDPLPCPGQQLPAQQAGQQAGHLTSANLPKQSTPSRDDFMRDVYDQQVTLALAAGASYTGSVPDRDLTPLSSSDVLEERRVRVHRSVAPAITDLLSAARSALASAKGSDPPTPAARRVRDIRVRSGYRSAGEQKSIWQENYSKYYRETQAQRRVLPGGPHGEAAVKSLAQYINERVHSPGYSAHQIGRTADLTYQQGSDWAEASTAPADLARWESSWLFTWLLKNAGIHGFKPNPNLNEPWHWEHR